MQHVVKGYKGLGLLFDINNDRLLSIVIIAAAMAAVALVGVEYVNPSLADATPLVGSKTL
ncbi:MAG: hypothetical protein KDA67_15660 [Rhodobacteraceae bacterium]|nr:hypothetical protein [Paracoccaceae bacterium]